MLVTVHSYDFTAHLAEPQKHRLNQLQSAVDVVACALLPCLDLIVAHCTSSYPDTSHCGVECLIFGILPQIFLRKEHGMLPCRT